MGIGLNLITSAEASKWVQDSAFQVLSEGGLKAVGRPAFTLADKNASPEAKKYSASKELIFQTLSMASYFAIITTVFQKLGFKALKNMPKFKDFDALKKIDNFGQFSHTFDAFSKGQIKATAQEAAQLEKTKGGMELIKMAGSGVILTILCPMFVTKLVHPIMNAIFPKKSEGEQTKTIDVNGQKVQVTQTPQPKKLEVNA
ncbi:hypothetical protein IJV79_01175 [bacterium]|nr:hypothetical protein [bacterium]